jgi:hypothetical protein
VLALRQTGSEATLPHRATTPVRPVDILHVALPQVFHHQASAVLLLRRDQQMHMIGHQAVGVNVTAKFRRLPGQIL